MHLGSRLFAKIFFNIFLGSVKFMLRYENHVAKNCWNSVQPVPGIRFVDFIKTM